MKKILLVNTNEEKNPYPVPPLGLCLLSSVLENEYRVQVYDGTFLGRENLRTLLRKWNPHYIGVSIRNIDDMDMESPTDYIDVARSYIRLIREESRAILILGGSGFSIFPVQLMAYYDADFGVIGEGEAALPRLLEVLEQGGDPSTIPGIISRQSSCFQRMGSYLIDKPSGDIDRFIDFTPYRQRGAYSIQTKRGCGHRCIYCTYNVIEGKSFRTRPADSVADEIEKAHQRLGQVTFEFVDSTFNDPPGHAEGICRAIIERGMKVRLRTMGINPANVTEELFDLMQRAGFAQIDCTPDTASPRMLTSLQKNFTLKELEKSASIIRSFGMPSMWFFLFGGPGETAETVKETFDFIDRWVDPYDMVHMTCGLRIYPATDLCRAALEEGYIREGSDLLQPLFYVSKEIGRDNLVSMIKEASLKRPNCIPSTETAPPPEMMREALRIREDMNNDEPMFRTLLRLRYRDFQNKNQAG